MDQTTTDLQDKVIKVNQNIGDHPAWSESPAEQEIGESTVEAPPTPKKEESKNNYCNSKIKPDFSNELFTMFACFDCVPL